MSEDLTQKLPRTDSEKLTLILTTVQNLDTRVTNIELLFPTHSSCLALRRHWERSRAVEVRHLARQSEQRSLQWGSIAEATSFAGAPPAALANNVRQRVLRDVALICRQ